MLVRLCSLFLSILLVGCNSTTPSSNNTIIVRNINAVPNYQIVLVNKQHVLQYNETIKVKDSLPLRLFAQEIATGIHTDTVEISKPAIITEILISQIINNKLLLKYKLVNDKVIAHKQLIENSEAITNEEKLATKSTQMLFTVLVIIALIGVAIAATQYHKKRNIKISMQEVEGEIKLN